MVNRSLSRPIAAVLCSFLAGACADEAEAPLESADVVSTPDSSVDTVGGSVDTVGGDATPADPCADGGGCDANATCAPEGDAPKCTCKPGWSGPGTTCTYDGVIVSVVDRHEAAGNTVTKVPDEPVFESLTIVVQGADGPTTYEPDPPIDGRYAFPGVPAGMFTLVARYAPSGVISGQSGAVHLLDTDARELNIGTDYSYRDGTKALTKPTFILVSGKLTQPWETPTELEDEYTELSDALTLYSRGAYLYTWVTSDEAMPGAPKRGDTALDGWKIDVLEQSLLGDVRELDGGLGDELVLLHSVDHALPAGDTPDTWDGSHWSAARSFVTLPNVTLRDGDELPVSGTFETKAPEKLDLDYDGEAFSSLLAPFADTITGAYTYYDVILEAGTPTPQVGSFAILLDGSVNATAMWADPTCNPDMDPCDPALCPNGCPDTSVLVFPGSHKQSYEYVNPFDYGQLIHSVTLNFSFRVTSLLAATDLSQSLSGRLSVSDHPSKISGKPTVPRVGLPSDITVNGGPAPVTAMTGGVGLTPVIAWEPPTTGTPTEYNVDIIELDDLPKASGGTSRTRVVLRYRGQSTSLAIPEGVLTPGRHYTAMVDARVVEGLDPAWPYRPTTSIAQGTMPSGVFAPCSCPASADCSLDGGVEKCTCQPGWEGDGTTCEALPCTLDNGGCPPTATCTNVDGAAQCACPDGEVDVWGDCMPDPCAVDNGGCDPGATCDGSNGYPECS